MNSIVGSLVATMNAQLPSMYSSMPGIHVVEETDWLGMLSKHPDVFYNAVYEARFSDDTVIKRVDEVVSLFSSRSQLPMTWFLTPTCQPDNLAQVLEAKGFKHAFRTPGMYLHLTNFEGSERRNSSHQIVRVTNLEQLSQWLSAGKDSFGLSDSLLEAYFQLFHSRGFGDQLPWRLFVGTVDGTPTTCVRLFLGKDTAGIFHVSTIESARGHGHGTEITATALEAAKDLGYKLATLASSPAGHNVYSRLGFRDCCFADVYIGPG